ncbi:Mitochondrial acidic protein mam33, partial [Coemansia erecta]
MKSVTRLLQTTALRGVARSTLGSSRIFASRALVPALRMQSQPSLSIRSLTTTMPMRGNGSVDSDLSHTLSEEIEYEAKQAAEEGEPEFIQAFANKTGFKIKTQPGQNRVLMTKQFGSESITVAFD